MKKPGRRASKTVRRPWRAILLWIGLAIAGMYGCLAVSILALRWIDPVTTAVQAERRLEATFARKPYHKHYRFIPLRRIPADLQHAVVAAEDGRFYHHHGFDWIEMQKIVEQDIEKHKIGRGGSTITQQLVKNLYLTTSRSFLRKGAEFAVVPLVEFLLSKDRILELYLNVIEWGPGVYGAEAASEYHYREPVSKLTRDQSARLAACIPNPRARKPSMMTEYSEEIERRMREMGW